MIRIGVDLGGTDIKIGAVTDDGRLLRSLSTPTRPERPFEAVVADICAHIRELLDGMGLGEADVASVGVGLPGAANTETGHALYCTNLGWLDVPFREEMQRFFSCPVLMENDANAAALAENRVGASRGCSSSVMITLGTGVGGGIILDGKPWRGFFYMAGEIGHMTLVPNGLRCNCGRSGCVERYCSATALTEQARQACLTHPENDMLRRAEGHPERITARDVVDAAKAGDETALRIFTDFARHLALAVDNVINTLNPEMIVLGGGVSRAGEFLLEAVRAWIPPFEMGLRRQQTRIGLAALGNEAGMIGAALLALI